MLLAAQQFQSLQQLAAGRICIKTIIFKGSVYRLELQVVCLVAQNEQDLVFYLPSKIVMLTVQASGI